jgi:plasmid stabilization system protein ParE
VAAASKARTAFVLPPFTVRLTREAEAELERLFDFLVERVSAREGGDLDLPTPAIAALRAGLATLSSSPFTCRKAGDSRFLRELIVSFGRSG